MHLKVGKFYFAFTLILKPAVKSENILVIVFTRKKSSQMEEDISIEEDMMIMI